MKFAIFILLFPFMLVNSVLAQEYVTNKTVNPKAKKLFEKYEEARKQWKPEESLKYLEKALEEEPNWINAHIEVASIYNAQKDFIKAKAALEKVVQLDSTYEPRVLYSLSKLHALDQEYGRATALLRSYLRLQGSDVTNREKLNNELLQWEWRKDAIANPVEHSPTRLPDQINTADEESLPSFIVDGSAMVFTRYTERQEDLYRVEKTATGWSQASLLPFNTRYNEGAQTMSADGKTIFFTGCNRPDGYGSCDIYVTNLINGEWSRPENLGEVINTPGWEAQPSLTPDGKHLYFSSAREGSQGGRDIWITTLTDKGQWGEPVNLGAAINTPGNDESPFICFDGVTLFFMSDYLPGMGDYDLFQSRRGKDGWSAPVNLGYPINTAGREGALTVHPDGRQAFYTSDQVQFVDRQVRKNSDIYSFPLPEQYQPFSITYVSGKVVDAVTGAPVDALISMYPLKEVEGMMLEQQQLHSGREGQFLFSLVNGASYGLQAEAAGYVFYSGSFHLGESGDYSARELQIALQPISIVEGAGIVVKPVVLQNVYFDFASAILLPESTPELQKLADLMLENPKTSVEILGHTDATGDTESNLELSKARARAVYQWLIDHGVDAERVSFKGLGESQPVADNETEEGRSQNRRTEFILSGGNSN